MVGKGGEGEELSARGECFMLVFRHETLLRRDGAGAHGDGGVEVGDFQSLRPTEHGEDDE